MVQYPTKDGSEAAAPATGGYSATWCDMVRGWYQISCLVGCGLASKRYGESHRVVTWGRDLVMLHHPR